MNKIAFLDRDGVINNDTGHYYIYKPEDFALNTDIIAALQLLQSKEYLIIVITNQGGIARGTYTKSDVAAVHDFFISTMEKNGVEIHDVYFCPHHDKFEACLCRKPNPLMIEKAIARYDGDKTASFMIGDNVKDVEAAHAANIRGYKIDKNTSILTLVNSIVNE